MKNPIILICVLCFAVRLLFCYLIFPVFGLPFIENVDIDNFGAIAKNMLHGYGFVIEPGSPPTLFRGPLYPLSLMLTFSIFGENLYAVQFMQSLLGTLTCFIIYLIAKKIFDRKTAILSAIIFTFYPLFIWYTARIWTETLLTFLVSILVLHMIKFLRSPSKTNAFILGIILGVINLCKSILLLFPIFLLLVFLVLFWHRKKEVLLNICLIIISMSLVITPWTYRNYKVSGHFVPANMFSVNIIAGDIAIEKGIVLREYRVVTLREAQEVYNTIIRLEETKIGRQLDIIEQEMVIVNHLFRKYLSSPLFFLKKVAIQSVQFWYLGGDKLRCLLFAIMQLTLLIPGLFGIIYAVRRRYFIAPLLWIIIYTILIYAISFAAARYSIPIMPYVGIFAAYAICHGFRSCPR
ncbi:MAG: hypothetical protein AMJ78_06505 [Omnitrophica WOR_2 bacterium SM23_29]|nr:MAG: hypothetical protein AMJ78_06505 [Omnitrophica WOR_2 bacterium SM23_29]